MIELALYQPDIPQNTGTLMRLCSCWSIKLHLIEPLGFVFNEHKMRRSAMDYIDQLTYIRHKNFHLFHQSCQKLNKRIVLSTTHGITYLQDFQFQDNDVILMGRETAGVPKDVHDQTHEKLRIPMNPEARSLNMAVSAAIITAQALIQTEGFSALS